MREFFCGTSFSTLFTGLGVTLPLPTKIVIALSNFIGSYFGLLILVGIIGTIVGLKVWYGNPTGKYVLDTIVLKLPVIGMLMRKIAVARFTRTLGRIARPNISRNAARRCRPALPRSTVSHSR